MLTQVTSETVTGSIRKKYFLKIFEKVTGKHPVLFFNKENRSFHGSIHVNFCEIFENSFFYRTLPVAASGTSKQEILYIPFA